MNTHTPGPWRVTRHGFQMIKVESKDRVIFDGFHNEEANAQLAATSPDMLSALRLALERLEHHTFQTETLADTKALLSIRAAINQATQP